MQKIFNSVLLIIFLVLVSLLAYKTLKTPEVSTISVTNTSPTDGNKSTPEGKELKFNEDEFNRKIHDYILNNPEVLIDSIENLQRKKMEGSNKKVANYLLENKSTIEDEGTPPTLGNKDSDITIVVFYDYNCSFCKQANKITNELLANDQRIRIVLRPIPILGGTSMYATKIALAVHKISEEKFPLIHNEMIKMKPITEEGVKALLIAHNIDYKIVDNELNSFSIKQLISKNFDLAKSLGIKGAPSYVVNGIFIPGLIDKQRFTAIITELRQLEAQAKNAETQELDSDPNASKNQNSNDSNKNEEESEQITN